MVMDKEGQGVNVAELPTGYRFLPTDQELVTHYLMNKVFHRPIPAVVAQDITATELYSMPPDNLVTVSCGEREWYFFIRDNKRILRENEDIKIVGEGRGFWKINGKQNPLCNSDGDVFAFKFQLTYFSGSISNARRTHWKMDAYRLPGCCARNLQEEEWLMGRLKRGEDYDTLD